MTASLDDIVFTAAENRRRAVVLITLVLWSVAIPAATWAALAHQSGPTRLVLAVLIALSLVSYLPTGVSVWRTSRRGDRLSVMFQSRQYLSEIKGIATKAQFLEEVSRELANSRKEGDACTMVVSGIPSLDQIRLARGDLIANRAVEELGARLVRAVRGSDPFGYLGQGKFATLLLDCAGEFSRQFMRRVPAEIAVEESPGHTHEFPIEMRGSEYEPSIQDAQSFLNLAMKGPIVLGDAGDHGREVA